MTGTPGHHEHVIVTLYGELNTGRIGIDGIAFVGAHRVILIGNGRVTFHFALVGHLNDPVAMGEAEGLLVSDLGFFRGSLTVVHQPRHWNLAPALSPRRTQGDWQHQARDLL